MLDWLRRLYDRVRLELELRRRRRRELASLLRSSGVPERTSWWMRLSASHADRARWEARRRTLAQLRAMAYRQQKVDVIRVETYVADVTGAEERREEHARGVFARREASSASEPVRRYLQRDDSKKKKDVVRVVREEEGLLQVEGASDAAPLERTELRRPTTRRVDEVRGYWDRHPMADGALLDIMQMPLVASQIRTLIKHLISAGAAVQGHDGAVRLVRRWFEVDLALTTGHERTLERFISELALQLLYYGTAVLVRRRQVSASLKPYEDMRGRRRAPVVDFAVPDMSTMEVFIGENGRPILWRQTVPGYDPITFQAEDVLVLRLPSQNSSMYFWTPSFVLPSLYALNVLRELYSIMERHTQALVDIPYYVTVGAEEYRGGEVTQRMIEEMRALIEKTPRGATLVLPWYSKINRVEVENYLDPLLKAADFWAQEVRRGVGGSDLTTDGRGNTTTRNTALQLVERDRLEARMLVPEIRRAFRWLTWAKLEEWAQRGMLKDYGIASAKELFESVESSAELCDLVFTEIDLAEQIRRETHALNKWHSGVLRHGEVRRELGYDPDDRYRDLYFQEIQALLKADASDGQAELVRSMMNPVNQHGGGPRPKQRSNS